MRRLRSGFVAGSIGTIAVLLAACGQQTAPEAAAPEPIEAARSIALRPGEAAHLGIIVSEAHGAAYAPEIHGYGVVITLDTIAQADADVATAGASAKQSAAALTRARNLAKENATSAEALDLAERQAASDATALALARRREAATFGQKAPWRSGGTAMLAKLANGGTVLLRATFPLGALKADIPATMRATRLDASADGMGWSATRIWSAPADTTIPGRSLFALIDGSDLAEGERLLVSAPIGTVENGVLIPSDAIVISEGGAWFYRATADSRYTRLRADFTSQAAGAFENIKTALAAVGASWDNVVKTTTYVTDLKAATPLFGPVRTKYVSKDNPPASTLLQVSALTNDALIEIDVVAAVPV